MIPVRPLTNSYVNFGRNLPSALPTFTPGNQNRKELYTTQSAYKVFMLGISLRNIHIQASSTSNAKKCCKGEWVLYGISPDSQRHLCGSIGEI